MCLKKREVPAKPLAKQLLVPTLQIPNQDEVSRPEGLLGGWQNGFAVPLTPPRYVAMTSRVEEPESPGQGHAAALTGFGCDLMRLGHFGKMGPTSVPAQGTDEHFQSTQLWAQCQARCDPRGTLGSRSENKSYARKC